MARVSICYGVFALICAFLHPPVISNPVKRGELVRSDTTPKIVYNASQQDHASLNPVIHRQNENQIVEETVPRPGRKLQSSKVKGVPLLNGNSLAFPHKGNILIKTPQDVSIDLSRTGDSYVSIPNGPFVSVSRTGIISVEQANGLFMQLGSNGQLNLVRKDGSGIKTGIDGTTEYFFKIPPSRRPSNGGGYAGRSGSNILTGIGLIGGNGNNNEDSSTNVNGAVGGFVSGDLNIGPPGETSLSVRSGNGGAEDTVLFANSHSSANPSSLRATSNGGGYAGRAGSNILAGIGFIGANGNANSDDSNSQNVIADGTGFIAGLLGPRPPGETAGFPQQVMPRNGGAEDSVFFADSPN